MLTSSLTVRTFVEHLQIGYRETYGHLNSEYAHLISSVAHLVLGKIATSDAPYHDAEHTMLVTIAGQEILRGKHLTEGNVSREDWFHFIIGLLCHDIGYVRGACSGDCHHKQLYATGSDRQTIVLPPGATDASLTPYHVDRSKQFLEEVFGDNPLIDLETIKRQIELTRFPVPPGTEHQDTINYPGLTRAADLIGQLGDPQYLAKIKNLFLEFEETGTNQNLGYRHPQELRAAYPNFFWKVAYPYIGDSLSYLRVTPAGQKIIKYLFDNVAIVETELAAANCLSAPRI
ncbi:MAG TPA: metal-dependent phosphohydrolase [Oscillatoriaceae cyanobacterium M33_DOE_052]|uniref:Metal-dependent phosphohydrolase n=1 Tax=Planktothricoides sp. SpSt-374 TaxID=2282167 RepID=A0A7C3VWK4_9CYAN|nr:metal-dependent phosphohydrolase [Oscillatoriaceae cyanobacterium M33_DOE_052]